MRTVFSERKYKTRASKVYFQLHPLSSLVVSSRSKCIDAETPGTCSCILVLCSWDHAIAILVHCFKRRHHIRTWSWYRWSSASGAKQEFLNLSRVTTHKLQRKARPVTGSCTKPAAFDDKSKCIINFRVPMLVEQPRPITWQDRRCHTRRNLRQRILCVKDPTSWLCPFTTRPRVPSAWNHFKIKFPHLWSTILNPSATSQIGKFWLSSKLRNSAVLVLDKLVRVRLAEEHHISGRNVGKCLCELFMLCHIQGKPGLQKMDTAAIWSTRKANSCLHPWRKTCT